MEEDIHLNEDKETLRRRLEVLRREYERTALRLKRAERRDAIHGRIKVSDHNTLTHNESSPCRSSGPAEPFENTKVLQLQTSIIEKSVFKKVPAVQFQLTENASLSSPACTRSPAHRLRSKRSRLRLQNKTLESNPDNNQEKEKCGSENNIQRGIIQLKTVKVIQTENGGKHEETKVKKERGFEMFPAKVEKNKDLAIKAGSEIPKTPQELSTDEKIGVNCGLNNRVRQCINKPLVLNKDKRSTFETLNVCQEQMLPVSHSVEKTPSTTAPTSVSNETSSESLHFTDKSDQIQTDCDAKPASFLSGSLDSCTLVEGLPFPVEYYIRTTRRMAASHSSVNLQAVIHSQLTRGRGRRPSQTCGGGHMTSERSESGCRSTNQSKPRGNIQKRKRGRRRTTTVRSSCSRTAADCVTSHPAGESQADCSSPVETPIKSQTPLDEPTCQSQLLLEKPEDESQLIQSLGPTENVKPSTVGVTQDFKHLPDSQLYFETKLLPESNLYPIFKRRRGQTTECSPQSQTCTSKDDQSPLLPSLSSLVQALQRKHTKCGQLAAVDIQDFHLPDDDFGQLKLERLRLSTSLVEPFVQRSHVYNTRRSNRCQPAGGTNNNSEVHFVGGEVFTAQPPPCSPLEDSLPLCQPDPVDQSQNETQNTDQSESPIDTKKQQSISSVLMDSLEEQTQRSDTKEAVILAATSDNQVPTQTVLSKDLETSASDSGNVHNIQSQVESQTLSENKSLCPAVLNLSASQTSPQRVQVPAMPSLGITPCFLSPGSPTGLLSPADSQRFSSSGTPTGHVASDLVSWKTLENAKTNTCVKSSDLSEAEQTSAMQNQTGIIQEDVIGAEPQTPAQNNITTGCGNVIVPETELAFCVLDCEQAQEMNLECQSKINCTSEIEAKNHSESESENSLSESAAPLIPDIQNNSPETEGQACKHTEPSAETQSHMLMNQCEDEIPNQTLCLDTSTNQTICLDTSTNQTICLNISTNQKTEEKTVCTTDGTEVMQYDESPTSSPDPVHRPAVLREMHTFKALEGGCVMDLCLVRWSLEDWCVCVAGERSVCLWAPGKGVEPWSRLHTWTFAQSVVSMRAIPDSSELLCVTLGDLEITEARALCCPAVDGPFTQSVVYRNALQTVVGVSNCRLVCCSTPGEQQKVCVIMLSKEGRAVNTLPLVSAKQNIRTLAAVEGEKDALIGWTDCKTLLIWSLKSGHLLQTVHLQESLTTTNCIRGYSYKGVLCVLLQNTGNVCEQKSDTSLFSLIATNPLTGKHFTLTSVRNPAQHIQQLRDADVFGSALVGVFQSGHVVVWDLRGVKVTGVLDEICGLARWAEPDTLLTGYLNGDVSLFQYKTT